MTHPQATRFLAKHMLSASKAGADLDWASLRKQAADEGLKLSDEDLNGAAATILSELSKAGQLSDDELDMVAGGTRQVVSTAFQNFDQKANQTYNILSSVMKSMNEMRMGTIRNML